MKKVLLGLLFSLSLLSNMAFAKCDEITISLMNWPSSILVTHVSKFLIEQGYGCKVVTVPTTSAPVLTSVAETGKPEIVTELWYNDAPPYDRLMAEGKIKTLTEVLPDGGIEGWWIPNYLVEAHPELATLEGILANPELVGGRIHSCPDGWACRNVNAALFKALDMKNKGFTLFEHGSGETLTTSIAAAFEDKSPWLGYYWAPTAILGRYPMTQVSFGAYNDEIHQCNIDANCANVGVSPYPKAPVVTVVSTTFSEKYPEISQLMSKVSFTNQQMGELLAWQEENKASPEEAAVYFLQNYSDVWAQWISDSAKSKLAALIK